MAKKRKTHKMRLITKCSEFCANSTIHGMRYLVGVHWSQKLTWFSILILSISFFGFLSQIIYTKFLVNPTVTVVETTHYSLSRVPFPAVTVCDTDLVYGPNTNNITDILRKRGYNESAIGKFYESIYKIGEQKDLPPFLPKIHSLLEDIGYPLWTLLRLFSKPCDVLLSGCAWRSAVYNCTLMFRQVLTHRGYCCQFDIDYFKKHSQNLNYISSHEASKALKVIVDGEKIYPNGTSTEGNVEVFIFNGYNGMTMLDNALPVRPSTLVDIMVEVWVIDTSDHVKTLSKHARKCVLVSDGTPDTSFYKGCVAKGFYDEMTNKCQCTPFYFQYWTHKSEYSNCTWEKYGCAHETFDEIVKRWKWQPSTDFLGLVIILMTESFIGTSDAIAVKYSCYPSCDSYEYNTQAGYTKVNVQSDQKAKNYSTVLIHFGDSTCIKYRREVLFTWDQMLASLGGIFGLSVGGSIISIIELIYFLLDLVFSSATLLLTPKEMNKENSDNGKTMVYTVHPKQIGNGKKTENCRGTNIYPFVN